MPPSATPRYATGRHRYKPILSMEIIPIFFTSQARKLTVYFLFEYINVFEYERTAFVYLHNFNMFDDLPYVSVNDMT